MMKKLVFALSLIIGLSSVNQAEARLITKLAILAVGIVALGYIYKYYCQEQERAKQQAAASLADEGAVLKHN